MQLAVVAWARGIRRDDGGFTGSRRSPVIFHFAPALWRHAASILFGLSGLSCALRQRSVVAHAFNSIWRGVGFGCDPPPFGWSRVAPRSRPYSFGMIVGVASDRRAHLCAHLFAHCLSTRALAHAYSLLWLARRSPGSCSLWDAVLGRRARLFRAISRAHTSVILQGLCCQQYMHMLRSCGTFR